jgi:mannose-6-phosphate isomerase-like protein (cupin superfamily)
VCIRGDVIWYDYPDTDETFLVLAGWLRIDVEDGSVELGAGEPFGAKGRRHEPSASEETKVMLIEPGGVLSTGREGGPWTADHDRWI